MLRLSKANSHSRERSGTASVDEAADDGDDEDERMFVGSGSLLKERRAAGLVG